MTADVDGSQATPETVCPKELRPDDDAAGMIDEAVLPCLDNHEQPILVVVCRHCRRGQHEDDHAPHEGADVFHVRLKFYAAALENWTFSRHQPSPSARYACQPQAASRLHFFMVPGSWEELPTASRSK